jgi:hypothetical protein
VPVDSLLLPLLTPSWCTQSYVVKLLYDRCSFTLHGTFMGSLSVRCSAASCSMACRGMCMSDGLKSTS